ncbi:hypothetical protein Pmani_008514 [Petrolisthes manimaculis]|uniref:DUF7869 domain-containing protein n=1 Tax=Petrolisthes manimaculis TaxID=1843537 RepID=A0AAE1UHP1_9EUCA|nr:hypothetical protein Pmani_008514 [Petrolisthes manimaculis]
MASPSSSTSVPAVEERPEGPGDELQMRKRRDETQWKRNLAKRKKNSGQEYVGLNTGKTVAAKQVGPPCGCPKGCFLNLGEEAVQRIFSEYWKMGDYNAQSAYIVTMVLSKEVKNSGVVAGSRRKATLEYGVNVDSKRVVVCKKAFLSIHAISDKRVLTVLKKLGDTGVAAGDLRGTHGHPHNKKHDEVERLAQEHIRSLPLCSSHYSRAKSRNKMYLPPDFTQAHCYSLFQQWCEEKGVEDDMVMSFDGYKRKVCEFNIGTSPPKVDTCSICDKFRVQVEVAKAEKDVGKENQLNLQWALHQARYKAARNLLQVYSEVRDDTQAKICMDLQQTLVTPRLTTNVAYYKRKIWTYNFGIHDLTGAARPLLYVWNEAVAKRGSCEIASCLIHYIENFIPRTVNKLVIFSDNCGGQNKNINLCLQLLRLVHSQRFYLIKHYFMMPGHSYMPCDQDFGHLEKFFTPREIYTTDHYIELMREARQRNPFIVVKMTSEMFFDLLPLQACITKTQVAKSKFKEGRLFVYKADYKQGFRIHHSYFEDGEEEGVSQTVKLQKGKRTAYNPEIFDLSVVELPVKYPQGVALRQDKLTDLNHLLQFIPLSHKGWYQDLFAAQGLLAAAEEENNPDDPEIQDDDLLDY